MKDITRLEVINEKGRLYVNMNCEIELSKQDEGRTLKIFVKNRKDEFEKPSFQIKKLIENMGVFDK